MSSPSPLGGDPRSCDSSISCSGSGLTGIATHTLYYYQKDPTVQSFSSRTHNTFIGFRFRG